MSAPNKHSKKHNIKQGMSKCMGRPLESSSLTERCANEIFAQAKKKKEINRDEL